VSAPLALLFLLPLGCTKTNDGSPPPAEKVEKAGNSVTAAGCISGMSGALSLAVHDLHMRTLCSRDSETGKFNWSYMYRESMHEGSSYDTFEKCVDQLATHLNDHIPYLEISLTERCAKTVKIFNNDRVVWAFEYGRSQ
jgi:hypothetical protein